MDHRWGGETLRTRYHSSLVQQGRVKIQCARAGSLDLFWWSEREGVAGVVQAV